MKPSEFFNLTGFDPARLSLPEVDTDENPQAVRLVSALVKSALLDYELLTGLVEWPAAPANQQERKAQAVFLYFLTAAVLRYQKNQMALDAKRVHNPDVQQNVAFNLDLVRVVGRAMRGEKQEARKIWRGDGWLDKLVTHAQQ